MIKVETADEILDHFRRWGYLHARLDPMGFHKQRHQPELDVEGEFAELGMRYYCSTIGVEYMHMADRERREWVRLVMERDWPQPGRQRILENLVRAEIFEQVLQRHYPGTKRFSIEGTAALIPLLHHVINAAADDGVQEIVIGMSHRGKLNVITNIVGRPPVEIFAEFQDVDPHSVLGGGDVKYHLGATGKFVTADGKSIQVRVVSGPSHLEAVDPVAMGRVRAKQIRAGANGTKEIVPVLIHGDAAFAGQGVAAETLNLANLHGYSVGGTIHIVVNNLIGFTAKPDELYSSGFPTDVAKRLDIPIFHVNAEDPDAVVRVGALAAGYRSTFLSGVVIDLVGFRRHGHSEIDDPTMTQPLLYEQVRRHPPLWQLYAKQSKLEAGELVEAARAEFEQANNDAAKVTSVPRLSTLPEYWSGYQGGPYDVIAEVDTAVSLEQLRTIGTALVLVPEGFSLHPKLTRLLERRAQMIKGEAPVDFSLAEMLAFGSLLREGIPVRLSGQDSRRGTFGQRHAVWVDTVTENEYNPLSALPERSANVEVYNTMLSEAAVLGFEYGFSRESPEALVMWEAQFGDFANGAQVIIDQFIAAGEDKWGLLSGLVLLLPHGYEGQGPEHSSARIERFLQLAAEDNIQVCQPSTAAQYFHLLRRQALRRWRKPLVIFTPKSMLRFPGAGSPLADFAGPRFQTVIADPEFPRADRVILCSGKIGHELRSERSRRGDTTTAIVSLDQLYPFPEKEIEATLKQYNEAKSLIWVQEEPANMGAYTFVFPRLQMLAGTLPLRSVRRSVSASPATGSAKAHRLEQEAILAFAFTA